MDLTLEELVEKYKGYAKLFADHYQKAVFDYGIEYDDLYQEALFGLISTYKDYSGEKSSLNTYTYNMMKYSVLNYIQENSTITHVPKPKKYLAVYLMKKEAQFYELNGREMTKDEKKKTLIETYFNEKYITDELMETLEIIKKLHFKGMEVYTSEESKYFKSKNNLYDGYQENDIIMDLIAAENNTEEEAINNYLIEQLLNSIEILNEREKDIFVETLGLVDGIEKTRQNLSDKYNVSRQRIDVIYKNAREKVKTYVKSDLI